MVLVLRDQQALDNPGCPSQLCIDLLVRQLLVWHLVGDCAARTRRTWHEFLSMQRRHWPTLWSRTRITYNAVNSRTLRTDDAPRGINSPDMGWRNYLDPVYPADEREAQQWGFICYVFTFNGQQPKGVIRLGKKGAAIRVYWEEIETPLAIYRDEPVRPTHPLNPLDVSGQVNAYEPVGIPPHLLLRTAEVRDDWFVFAGPHRVHVPKRVVERCLA